MTVAAAPPKAPPRVEFRIGPTQTQGDFIQSMALENCFFGPRGSGKSFAGVSGLIAHALRQKKKLWPIPSALCRDTRENLKKSAIPTFHEWEHRVKERNIDYWWECARRGLMDPDFVEQMVQAITSSQWVTEHNAQKELHVRLNGQFLLRLYLLGMDESKDVSQFQSLQLGSLWLEEAAPAAAENIGKGIQEYAWLVGLTSLRYPVDRPRAQITMNYPDEDHWTWERFVTSPEHDTAYFRSRREENAPNLPQGYFERMDKQLAKNPQLHRRLSLGEPGVIQLGKPVTPEFSEKQHVAPQPFQAIPFADLLVAWDFGLNPTAVVMQQTPNGHLNCLLALTGENMGMRQFIETMLRPALARRVLGKPSMSHFGDPAGRVRDPSDSTKTPVQTILDMLGGTWQSGPKEWPPRREALRDLLTKQHVGRPYFMLDQKECKALYRALRGGWHYPETQGTGTGDLARPVKDVHSHPGDALSYIAAVLMSQVPGRRALYAPPKPAAYGRNMAAAFAGRTLVAARH